MSPFRLIVIALLLSGSASPALANLVTINGTDVSFTYDPSTFSVGPNIGSNGVSYLGNRVTSQAGGSSGNGVNLSSSTITFFIQLTNPSEQFNNISLSEHGSYFLAGPNSSVSLAGSTMTISDVSAPSLTTGSAITSLAPMTTNDGVEHGWDGNAASDLSSSQWSSVRSLKITVVNELTASALSGSSASISAGFAGLGSTNDTLSVGVSAVPLPTSFLLFATGLLGLFLFTRRAQRRFDEFAT